MRISEHVRRLSGPAAMGLLAMVAGCVSGTTGQPDPDPDQTADELPRPCPVGQLWADDLDDCVPAACGTSRFAELPDERAGIYVDASYDGGSNGTVDNPYRTLGEALEQVYPGVAILVAAGDYTTEGHVELFQSDVDLIGRCSELVRLRPSWGQRALRLGQTSDNTVSGLSFLPATEPGEDTGEPLVELFNGTGAVLDRIAVYDAVATGLQLWQCGGFTLRGSVVSGSGGVGVAIHLSSEGLVAGNVIRDSGRSETADLGDGLEIQQVIDMVIEGNQLENNRGAGLAVSQGDTVDVHGNTARSNDDGGLLVIQTERADVAGNLVESNGGPGLLLAWATGAVTDNTVRSTRDLGGAVGGRGIEIADVSEVAVTGNHIESNNEVGLLFADGTGSIVDNVVRSTGPAEPGDDGYVYGHGIHVQNSSQVTVRGNEVSGNVHAGIYLLWVLDPHVADNHVSSTYHDGLDGWSAADGVVAIDGSGLTTIEDNTISGNVRCGVLLHQTEAAVAANTISGNSVALISQGGAVLDLGDNDIVDNTSNDARQTNDILYAVTDVPLPLSIPDEQPED